MSTVELAKQSVQVTVEKEFLFLRRIDCQLHMNASIIARPCCRRGKLGPSTNMAWVLEYVRYTRMIEKIH